jgi:hypothetical protein
VGGQDTPVFRITAHLVRQTKKDTMHKRTKLLVTALLAVFVCSLAASSAYANRSIRIAGGPRVQSESLLTFKGEGEGGAREITCDVTLLRTVAEVIPKTSGTLFGKVTGVAIDRGETARSPRCRNGGFIRLTHDIVPLIGPERECLHNREDGRGRLLWDCSRAEARLWKLIYDSFQGTLPRIEGINFHIQNVQFTIRILGPFGETQDCLYEGNGFGLIVVNADGTITRARAVEPTTRLPRIRGGGLCPARGSFTGSFLVRPTLTITLQ